MIYYFQSIRSYLILFMVLLAIPACLQQSRITDEQAILASGAAQTELYLPLLEGKRVGLIANQASLVSNVHLADTLLALGVDLVRIFAPEHGFRGVADAGAHIKDGQDISTGLPVISLYGANRKPKQDQLDGIDVLIFDLQDVGVRFYTYISTLTYVMEAAAEKGIPLIVLDRPNPNGFYIDGPVLEKEYASFVGMHPVPIVYGMTIGEYGMMVNGESWLANNLRCDLKVIPMSNYDRDKLYQLPVKPSPNLPNWQSVYLYPSLCLFEGTVVSVGRGTETPFTVYGHPDFTIGSYVFTPHPVPGAAHPKLEGQTCYGQNLMGYAENFRNIDNHLNLDWLINAYQLIGNDSSFFTAYFEKLSGTPLLRKQIMVGKSQEEIKTSWKDGIDHFKLIRKKFLIYDDCKNN